MYWVCNLVGVGVPSDWQELAVQQLSALELERDDIVLPPVLSTRLRVAVIDIVLTRLQQQAQSSWNLQRCFRDFDRCNELRRLEVRLQQQTYWQASWGWAKPPMTTETARVHHQEMTLSCRHTGTKAAHSRAKKPW